MNAAPNPIDTQDFQFKHASTQHICDNLDNVPTACSLIVADCKRGLLYIAHGSKLTVLKYDSVPNNRYVIDYNLPHQISKLSINCDYSYLGVTFNKSTAYIYKASSLSKNSLELLHDIQLSSSSPDVYGYDLRWNPAVPGMFCTIASDHSIGCFEINVEQKTTVRLVALEKLAGLEAMCVAWSPKGKQLVIGCKNGNIVQLKPELKVARTIPGPSPAIGEVIAILWISNYQFCAAYSNINERRVNVLIVNAPKGETIANFMCYEDITYGMPDMDGYYSPRYYFDHVPEWNLIIAASSSSSEIAVLGSRDNGTNWEQWQLIDSGRAQLPLIRTTETYPVGMTIDKSSMIKLPWGPENTLPCPVPILHIFGTSGQIISFHMVNLQPNCPSLCSPASEPVTLMSMPRTSILPSEISFNNPGITSTPRPKETEQVMDRPKVFPTSNLFNNLPTTANAVPSASILPQSVPAVSIPRAIPTTPAPAALVNLKIPKPAQEKVEVVPIREAEQTRLSPVKEVPIATTTPENAMLNDAICWRAYKEELICFEEELKTRLKPQVWQVGTEEERRKLIGQCAEIDEFWRELRETTNSLTNEIEYLKALLLQSIAWVEETKSRNSATDSEIPRDRHDRSKIEELKRLASYTQLQLMQAMKALDMQWTEYQSQERSKMKTPSLEYVYQGLAKHSEIIARQKKTVETFIKKLKTLQKDSNISCLNRSIAKLNLSAKAVGSSSRLNTNGGIIEMRCKTIANNAKNFTKQKQMKLREILQNNNLQVIKPKEPTPIQDRLKATLSSLASTNSVSPSPKQKIEKSVSIPSTVTNASPSSLAKTVTTTSFQKIIDTPQSPLTSLNHIVANIGPTGPEAAAPPLLPTQSKYPTVTFSTTSLPSFFGNTSVTVKSNTSASTQLQSKSNVTNQSSNAEPSSLLPQSSATANTFPKVSAISSGTPNQKLSETVTVANTIPKDMSQKNILTLKPKDIGTTAQSPQPFFDRNLFASSSNTGSPTSGADRMTAQQPQMSINLGSGSTLSFKDSQSQATTTQQSVFSFASTTLTTVSPKITSTTANNVSTDSSHTFSFAPKPLNLQAFPPTTPASFSTAKSAVHDNLDLSKMNVGLQPSNLADKPPTSAGNTTFSFRTTFGEPATPISSTINFAKASGTTTDASSPQQENKSFINLPPGTSIEKVSGFAGKPGPTASGSIFGGNSTFTSETFGKSTFGGTSMSSPVSLVAPLSTTNETSTVVSTSIFSPASNNACTQNSSMSSTTAPPPAYNSSQFSKVLGDIPKNTGFGSPQSAEVSPIFSKSSETSVSSPTVASSPFTQSPTSPLSPTNLTKNQSTPTATTGFFANSANSTNIFGGMSGSAVATPKLFGGNTGSPTVQPSMLNSAGGAAQSPFGGASFGSTTFGSQPVIPAAAPTPAFGGTPTFSAKPSFTGQPSMFGATKSEFGNVFGSSGFGSPSGFGSAPTMAGSPPSFGNPQMGKVFGSPTGNNTFESLAGQNTQLTFDSLAQKSPSPEKPPSFSGGSSFSKWR